MSIFKINGRELEVVDSSSANAEIKIEEVLESVLKANPETETGDKKSDIKFQIFGEEGLFFVNRQQRLPSNKKPDIMAIDSDGRIVIIEIKREKGKLGVDMQALHYVLEVVDFPEGDGFFNHKKVKIAEEDKGIILGNLGNKVDNINKEQRIILVARDFDEAVYSMGVWLSEKGIAFTCIAYDIYKIANEEYISFSTKFDVRPYNFYKFGKKSVDSGVNYYYHNTGVSKDLLGGLLEQNIITCGFKGICDESDRGWKMLNKKYKCGDKIFLYQNGHGIVAVGTVKGSYEFKENLDNDGIKHKHRLAVKWEAKNINDPFKCNNITENYGVYANFRSTSSFVAKDRKIAEGFYKIVLEKLKIK